MAVSLAAVAPRNSAFLPTGLPTGEASHGRLCGVEFVKYSINYSVDKRFNKDTRARFRIICKTLVRAKPQESHTALIKNEPELSYNGGGADGLHPVRAYKRQ